MSDSNKPSFIDIFTQLKDEFSKPENTILYTSSFMFALIITICAFAVLVYYGFTLFVSILNSFLVKTPLNMETIEFNVMNSTSFLSYSKYMMWLFLALPILALGGCITFIAVTYAKTKLGSSLSNAPTMSSLTWVILMHNLLLFIGFLLFFMNSRRQNSSAILRVDKCNNFIKDKIYKSASFLKKLATPQTDIISLMNTFTEAMKELPTNIEVPQLAKAFYSLHIYSHFHKLGIRNPRLIEALGIFDPMSLLIGICDAANYLNRYGTFIEDNSELIKKYLPPNIDTTSEMGRNNVKAALTLCYDWITQTNNLANSLYPEDSWRPFQRMFLVLITLNLVSIILMSYLISNGDVLRKIVNRVAHIAQATFIGTTV